MKKFLVSALAMVFGVCVFCSLSMEPERGLFEEASVTYSGKYGTFKINGNNLYKIYKLLPDNMAKQLKVQLPSVDDIKACKTVKKQGVTFATHMWDDDIALYITTVKSGTECITVDGYFIHEYAEFMEE